MAEPVIHIESGISELRDRFFKKCRERASELKDLACRPCADSVGTAEHNITVGRIRELGRVFTSFDEILRDFQQEDDGGEGLDDLDATTIEDD